jgi:hypothetical protein
VGLVRELELLHQLGSAGSWLTALEQRAFEVDQEPLSVSVGHDHC